MTSAQIRLSIGFEEFLPLKFFPSWIKSLETAESELNVSFVNLSHRKLVCELLDQKIETMAGVRPIKDSRIVSKYLMDMQFGFYTSSLALSQHISGIKELKKYPVMTDLNFQLGDGLRLVELLAKLGLTVSNQMGLENFMQALTLAEAGYGVAYLSEATAFDSVTRGRLYPINVTHNAPPELSKVEIYLSSLKAYAEKESTWCLVEDMMSHYRYELHIPTDVTGLEHLTLHSGSV